MKVKLLCDRTTPEHWISDTTKKAQGLYFRAGETVEVIPASNMPAGSDIKFWINQGAAVDHLYGVAVYSDEYERVK